MAYAVIRTTTGGLGIVHIRTQNEALLMKHLHKFFNKADTPWVQLVWRYYADCLPQAANLCGSFWWRDVLKLMDSYRAITLVQVSAGDTTLFWSDRWHSGQLLSHAFPRLFSFSLQQNLSVLDVLSTSDRIQLYELPLSQQAYSEFQELELLLQSVTNNPDEKDHWITIWPEGKFTASHYYQHSFRNVHASRIFSFIWKSKVILRIKVFAWLLVSDRLNTRDVLRRRNWNVTDVFHCTLCPTMATEDWMHLFFDCNFSVRIWQYLQIEWTPDDTFEQIFLTARRNFNRPFFTEIVILAAWNIWKQRNEAVFQHILPSFRGWRRGFIHDITMHVHRVKDRHSQLLASWIENLS